MAGDDGLFETNLFFINHNGEVALDLMPTFPQAMRGQMESLLIEFSLRDAKVHNEDIDDTMRLLRHIMPVRGMGRTQAESSARGWWGVENQGTRRGLERLADHAVHGILVDSNPIVGAPGEETPERRDGDPPVCSRKMSWPTVAPSIVRHAEVSPFSTGIFHDRNQDDGPWTCGRAASTFVEVREERREGYERAWAAACERELSTYKRTRENILAASPSSSLSIAGSTRQSRDDLPSPSLSGTRSSQPTSPGVRPDNRERQPEFASPITPQRHSTPRANSKAASAASAPRKLLPPYAGNPDDESDESEFDGEGNESADL
ncbi:hypothetical protein FRC12_005528 [Ceratobasidium sp. 428]|nr:hypothetical protein FRC12_005528 [Ceratobasidium sp. 428]